ncbi:hypothetical protein NEFER03_1644 [Nematocida sp. LUAm3]|nr:hypothetical protein NEFER03_1644 [Nematocida sp. LUAm3]KAI5174668.1 hypothetical protein NEFER02_0778 [Nematocida sp. LUAm2]KAI5177922.1 hypothetical protein NEFER01_1124 [Nematocida sp. LUAm1]
MKIRIPVCADSKPIVVRIPMDLLEVQEAPKIDLIHALNVKMNFLLNSIYGILTNDLKEQEKRRRIIGLYGHETQELCKLIGLFVLSSNLEPLDHLESMIYRIERYNREAEELADRLVYRCNDLKMEASSGYDVERAIDTLLRGKIDLSSSTEQMYMALAGKKSERKEFPKIQQMMIMQIHRAELWKSAEVTYSIEEDRLVLDSYGYRTTLLLCSSIEDPKWHILSIIPMEHEGRSIPAKYIKGENLLKEIVALTKYAKCTVEVEEAYKMVKAAAERKIFEIEVTGDSKRFKCSILTLFKMEVSTEKDWNGASVWCKFYMHTGEVKLFKKDILSRVTEEITRELQEKISCKATFSLEKGLLYMEHPYSSLRDLQRECKIDQKKETVKRAPGVIIKEKHPILLGAQTIHANVFIIGEEKTWIAVYMDSSSFRVFYGSLLFPGALPTATEIPVAWKDRKTVRKIDSNIDCMSNDLRNSKTRETRSTIGDRDARSKEKYSLLRISTCLDHNSLYERIIEYPCVFMEVLGLCKILHNFPNLEGIIIIDENISFIADQNIEITLEFTKNESFSLKKVCSPYVAVSSKIKREELKNLLWVSVFLQCIQKKESVFSKKINEFTISGKAIFPCREKSGIMLKRENLYFSIGYSEFGVECAAENYLISSWVFSIIKNRSVNGFLSLINNYEILLFPGLISTLPTHNLLGGSFPGKGAFIYTVAKEISISWTKDADFWIKDFLKDLPVAPTEERKASLPKSSLRDFLSQVSALLLSERASQLKNGFTIFTEDGSFFYSVEHCENKLICTKEEEGLSIDVNGIISNSPDPESVLLRRKAIIIPK